MTREEAIETLRANYPDKCYESLRNAVDIAVEALKADPKETFYDGYAYCLVDFGWDTVLCRDCKHQEQIAGYSDYQPNTVFCNKWEHLTDIQGYCYKGERKDEVENG